MIGTRNEMEMDQDGGRVRETTLRWEQRLAQWGPLLLVATLFEYLRQAQRWCTLFSNY